MEWWYPIAMVVSILVTALVEPNGKKPKKGGSGGTQVWIVGGGDGSDSGDGGEGEGGGDGGGGGGGE